MATKRTNRRSFLGCQIGHTQQTFGGFSRHYDCGWALWPLQPFPKACSGAIRPHRPMGLLRAQQRRPLCSPRWLAEAAYQSGWPSVTQKDRWLQSDTRSDISPLVMADGRQTAGAGIRKDPAGIGPAQVAPEARACSITCCSASSLFTAWKLK